MRMTADKGVASFPVKLATMIEQDMAEAQKIEDQTLPSYGLEPRRIRDLLAGGTHFGLVARDKYESTLLGYVLYSRVAPGIRVNGEYGVLVKPNARRHRIGTQLIKELMKEGLPIIFEDVNLLCGMQCCFLESLGVDLPRPRPYVTVEWKPGTPTP